MKMKGQKYSIAFYLLILLTFCSCVYSDYNDHISPGNTTYYINPTDGDDENSGLKSERAWPTFSQINNIKLSAGDRVEITSPGSFDQSLLLSGDGTVDNPVEVHFAKGQYDFFPDNVFREKYNISNTNASPDSLKAVGILLKHAKNFKISSNFRTFFWMEFRIGIRRVGRNVYRHYHHCHYVHRINTECC